MQVEQVQRWVITALVSTMSLVWIACQVWAAVGIIEEERTAARVMLLVIGVFIGALTIVGLRILHQKSWKTPWLLFSLLPLGIGLWLM